MKRAAAFFVAAFLVCASAIAASLRDNASGMRGEATASEVKQEAPEAASPTSAYLHQKREDYQKRAGEKLHTLEKKISELAVRAGKAVEKTRDAAVEKAHAAADRLKEKSRAAGKKLNELRTAGGEKWESIKKELDLMLRDLDHGYHNAASTLKPDKENNN